MENVMEIKTLAYLTKARNEMIDNLCSPPVCTKPNLVPVGKYCKGSLADCKSAPVCTASDNQEGNNPMSAYASATIAAPTTETQDQRKYLEKRLNEVYRSKRDPLEAKFGLVDDDAPQGAAEFQKRIADGAYTMRTGDKYQYWHWTDLIQWRHPDRKQDNEGFAAARTDLKAKKQAALDIIKIEDPTAGLKAIKDLESWEPTGAAN